MRFAFTALTNSARFLKGESFDTSIRLGIDATPATAFKSLVGSKLSFAKLGLVDRLTDANRNVCPSGLANLATYSAPIFPPAPGLSSGKTVCPITLPISSAITRPRTSAEPPAA